GYINIEKGTHTWTNVYIEKYKISSNVGLVSMKNVTNDVKFISVTDNVPPYNKNNGNSIFRFGNISNTKEDAKGGALYLKNVKNISMEQQGNGGIVMDNDTAENGYGGVLYIDDADTDTCTLNMNKVLFNWNKALYGGAIYVRNNTANVENAKNIINYISTVVSGNQNDTQFVNHNEAMHKGGFICMENTSGAHDPYRDEFNMKVVFSGGTASYGGINFNKTTSATMPGGGGGFGYFEDAKVYIDSENNAGNNRKIFFYQNESAEAGGVILASRSDIKIGNVEMDQNKALGTSTAGGKLVGGSAIFIAADEKMAGSDAILDSLTLGASGVTNIHNNDDKTNNGAVYVGRYANFYLDHKVVIKNNTKSGGAGSFVKNLYLNGKTLSESDDGAPSTNADDSYEHLGIERKILNNFDYTEGNSEIHTSVSLYDERVINGWLTDSSHGGGDPETKNVFHKDDTTNINVKVYKTGRASSRNVHVGLLQK
nr:hypothetical protein [Lachnospiraceae bacterium]